MNSDDRKYIIDLEMKLIERGRLYLAQVMATVEDITMRRTETILDTFMEEVVEVLIEEGPLGMVLAYELACTRLGWEDDRENLVPWGAYCQAIWRRNGPDIRYGRILAGGPQFMLWLPDHDPPSTRDLVAAYWAGEEKHRNEADRKKEPWEA